jgi:sugar phosphate isomerase/epimerase
MKLSISNIAWPLDEEEKFLKILKECGSSGVEIAPSKLWPDPVSATRSKRRQYRSMAADNGLEIPAIQALLYNRRDLGLFRSPEVEKETVEYLKKLCELAHDLGAKVLVFGSPSSRKRGTMPMEEALNRAASFFSRIVVLAESLDVCICIEPLRPDETDFIIKVAEGSRLSAMVNSAGFGLHLDAKAIAAEGSDYAASIKDARGKFSHFHINDPDLSEVGSTGAVDHFAMGKALRDSQYDRYVSIEMRMQQDHLSSVKKSLEIAKAAYIG